MKSFRLPPIQPASIVLPVSCGLLVFACTAMAAEPKPLSPEQALASIVVEPGLKLELVAAEPLTADPVAVTWDEQGRLFVAENRGYPVGPGTNQPPVGVIAMLEDTNRDGRMDKRTEFASGLTYPNGIMPWRGGFFVTCAPDIFYLKDTNGDGKADVRKVVLTGFMTNSTTQLRVAHPTLGLDGWVYVTAGLTGGEITSPEHPERPAVKFPKSDSRFHPDTFEIEPEPGQGQFGLCFDDFGRRFVVSNRNPLMHVVLHPRYLKRNPHLAFSDTVENVSPHGDAAKVWPLSDDQTTAAFHPTLMSTPHAGTFTSACGISIYRGNALPPEMYGNAFICEPAQNLVQRQIIEPDGPTFKSRPATPGRESIATRDSWFRPVFTANGPDGALYVCDMYRKVLDHPQYMPEYMRHTLDYDAGKGMGRIYRLTAEKGSKAKGQGSKLAKASSKDLVKQLNADDCWTRETAFRLLLERKDREMQPIVERITLQHQLNTPPACAAALWLLHHLGDLNNIHLTFAFTGGANGVREQALQLTEIAGLKRIVGKEAQMLISRGDARVRFLLTLLLDEDIEGDDPQTVFSRLISADASNRWSRAAMLSSMGPRTESFQQRLLGFSFKSQDWMYDYGHVIGSSLPPEKMQRSLCMGIVNSPTAETLPARMAFVTGVANAARSRGLSKGDKPFLVRLTDLGTHEDYQIRSFLPRFMQRARELAGNTALPVTERVAAIELLGHGDFAQSGEALQGLLNLQTPDEVQVAAVRALAQMPDDSVAKTFIAKWREYTPAVRDAVLGALLSQTRFLPSLLDAVEQGVVQAWAIPTARKNQLLKNRDQAIRTRAEKAFASQGGDRMKVYEELKPVASMKGSGTSGHAIFTKTCASCHRYNGEGAQVGPDLTGIRQQPAEALLLHIIAPNAEIYPGFTAYEVEMKDGRSMSGILASETPTSITVRAAQGIEETILRANLSRFAATSLSLMPEELEKTMTRQELADLLVFLKGGQP